MVYYTTFENYIDSAIQTEIELFPNIRSMVWVLPYEPVHMIIDRVKADEIRKEWKRCVHANVRNIAEHVIR